MYVYTVKLFYLTTPNTFSPTRFHATADNVALVGTEFSRVSGCTRFSETYYG
jgi:hypothetical protein